MFQKVITFIKYHNAVSIGFMVLFLGFGAAFAADEDLRGAATAAVISSAQTVTRVDNSLILNANLDQFQPSAQINNVTEDADNYYVSYTLTTIDLQDGRWNTVSQGKSITVSKSFLGNTDLGLYVAKQIKEVTDRQLEYLKEVQVIERGKGVTQKTVATTYSGLIGKFLDPKEEVIVGYLPVIPPEVRSTVDATANTASVANTPILSSSVINTNNTQSDDTIPPTITILGNNPATVEIRKSYSDNGANVTDNKDLNLGVSITVDGVSVSEVQIDTSVAGEHKIVYTATDSSGNSTSATRIIIVEDPNAPPAEELAEEQSTGQAASTTEETP